MGPICGDVLLNGQNWPLFTIYFQTIRAILNNVKIVDFSWFELRVECEHGDHLATARPQRR